LSEIALGHLRHLAAVIGPRGSCTEDERRAHAYCREKLEELGYDVRWEAFRSPRSGWHPSAVAFGLAMVAEILFLTGIRAATAVALGLVLFSLASLLLLLGHRRTPLRWVLPKGESQNVWARVPPREEPRRTLVLAAHVDSHRTVFAMASKTRFVLFRLFGQLTAVAMAGLLVVFAVALFERFALLTPLSLICAAIVLISLALSLWPDLTRYVAGANDNASGAAAVLELAARLKDEPLEHTEVCVLITGCEEVGGLGAAAFAAAHPELDDADYLVVDGIGAEETEPRYLLDETLFLPVKSHPALVAVARRVAEEGSFAARPMRFKGMSDMSPLTTAGRRAISFGTFRARDGMIPNWHQQSDTFERIDPAVLDNALEYVWAVARALDQSAR
jgi:hypothetical protein